MNLIYVIQERVEVLCNEKPYISVVVDNAHATPVAEPLTILCHLSVVHRLLPHMDVECDGLVHVGVVDETKLILALPHRHKTELLIRLFGYGVHVVASRSLHLRI